MSANFFVLRTFLPILILLCVSVVVRLYRLCVDRVGVLSRVDRNVAPPPPKNSKNVHLFSGKHISSFEFFSALSRAFTHERKTKKSGKEKENKRVRRRRRYNESVPGRFGGPNAFRTRDDSPPRRRVSENVRKFPATLREQRRIERV